MKREDVMKLVNAGFSKEEILGLLSETPEETPKETPEETPEENKPIWNPFEMASMTEGISSAIIEAIQKQNILNSSQKEETPISGEDILANVLDLLDE